MGITIIMAPYSSLAKFFISGILMLIQKPYLLGFCIYGVFLYKIRFNINIFDFFLLLFLTYHLGLLLELILSGSISACKFYILNEIDFNSTDHVLNMASNNNNNINTSSNSNGDFTNIPADSQGIDYARLIRYFSVNIAALAARRPLTRAAGLALGNTANILADIVSSEARANFWIDQYIYYRNNGRFRGGQPGSGPFERGNEFNPFDPNQNGGSGSSGISNFVSTSNFGGNSNSNNSILDYFSLDFFRDFFAPVEHSISLTNLVTIHSMIVTGLFFLVVCLILFTAYFYINLLILFNKDYLLTRVQNKYLMMYVKYVIFKTKIDLGFIAVAITTTLAFMAYVLHYLIVHPIIL